MTIRDHVVRSRARLVAAGIEPGEAAMDAELLAREALGWDRARFLSHDTDAAPHGFAESLMALTRRREQREPVSVILGRREFWGLEFEVTRHVLAPRPETEIIVEALLALLEQRSRGDGPSPGSTCALPPGTWDPASAGFRDPIRIADIGTGTGCLAISLALELPGCQVVATDVSPAALEVARRNAERHGVLERIEFRLASLLDGVAAPFDAIVSNPPYIPTGDLSGLPPEVRDHEPLLALDGGPDGLDLIRRVAAAARGVLAPGGWLVLEFGAGQDGGVRTAIADASLELTAVRVDLQGIPRTAIARHPGGRSSLP